jgi:predicted NBD/HSP70 family sugar kinase
VIVTIDIGTAITRIYFFRNSKPDSLFQKIEFPTEKIFEDQLNQIGNKISDVVSQARVDINLISVLVAGDIDLTTSEIIDIDYLNKYSGYNIYESFRDLYPNIDIYIDHKITSSLVAQVFLSDVQIVLGESILLYHLSNGVTGAYLERLTRKKYRVIKMELGHQIVKKNGLECVCGQRGCLQAYIGAKSIRDRFLRDQSVIEDGNLIDKLTDYFALGLANAMVITKPTQVLLTGPSINEITNLASFLKMKTISRLKGVTKSDANINLGKFIEDGPNYGGLMAIKIKNKSSNLLELN